MDEYKNVNHQSCIQQERGEQLLPAAAYWLRTKEADQWKQQKNKFNRVYMCMCNLLEKRLFMRAI